MLLAEQVLLLALDPEKGRPGLGKDAPSNRVRAGRSSPGWAAESRRGRGRQQCLTSFWRRHSWHQGSVTF